MALGFPRMPVHAESGFKASDVTLRKVTAFRLYRPHRGSGKKPTIVSGRPSGRRRAFPASASGQLSGCHRAVSRGRRHTDPPLSSGGSGADFWLRARTKS